MVRLAIVVSHPIQYYVPLYRRLALRDDVEAKVFYTWHCGSNPIQDSGFKKNIRWDIPLTDGYQWELLDNHSGEPGTHHFWGLRNKQLVDRVRSWKADIVLLTGYAYASHLKLLYLCSKSGIPVMLRGDSHLLDRRNLKQRSVKREVLACIYKCAAACLYVGQHNRDYYHWLGVPDERLFFCPHSVDVERFERGNDEAEREAKQWREQLGIRPDAKVLLFAGKFEEKKRPIELMQALDRISLSNTVLVMTGDGELSGEVKRLADSAPDKFRLLPFQNQSRMPVVYRMGDLFVLPSAYNETWGLAVNEALACGRPVLVSDRVGCAPELVVSGLTGSTFHAEDWADFGEQLGKTLASLDCFNKLRLQAFAKRFDVPETESYLMQAIRQVVH